MKRTLVALVVLAAAAPTLWSSSVSSASGSLASPAARATTAADQSPPYAANRKATIKVRFRAAVRGLPLAQQTPRGYDRDAFGDWRDSDGDCRDTRAEVLVAESRKAVTGDCTIETGRWLSTYDRVFWRHASDVDIDHVVPLFEVWRSGGKRWGPDRRVAYSNDLADGRTLKAVTDNVNQSKGDSDPADWLPQYGQCSYVRQYAAVKLRWSLKVNAAEKTAMRQVASRCPNVMIRLHKARVVSS